MSIENDHNCISPGELQETTRLNIEKYGLQVIMVSSTGYLPSFAYSIGLWQNYNHPEIICFGLSNDLGHAIINDVAAIIKQGERIDTGKEYDDIFNASRAAFLPVAPAGVGDYFNAAINYYGHHDFPALQLVWTDRNDRFPWEEDFEEVFIYKQPLLDRNMNFKFREPKNLTAFTSRQWLEDGKPILYVVHENDGDWQFVTGDELASDDIRIVALEQLVLRDETLNEVFDLDYGEDAERDFIGGPWTRKKVEYNDEE
ncbi:DUF4262 domain-containing protein [Mucilaginibacter sp. Bleaf8]|uniref:DUF4262 domain-containing protein n=1 Tax=Mucilaginibacter sp. Bleaf8 TaxID=2834430 RepID=UPI001BCFE516|nr:DUF4262 domain-containing protein [Mucilaginibacter sp. Bleaf8]MBS7565641.1 DUF4262 domain-containing protein [Mucilaginibacter sp. Bleaf8]